jgi:hypothetical protein
LRQAKAAGVDRRERRAKEWARLAGMSGDTKSSGHGWRGDGRGERVKEKPTTKPVPTVPLARDLIGEVSEGIGPLIHIARQSLDVLYRLRKQLIGIRLWCG